MIGTWGYDSMQCRIRPGRKGAGRIGEALCYLQTDHDEDVLIVVIWDGEKSPSFFKADDLQIKYPWDLHWGDAP